MTKNIRVRFAPSPTGALHIGGVRTALYNYLWAKKHNGTFILRIEDTDQGRFVEGAENYIEESLKWLGIQPDESPSVGGAYGPYRQSERKARYMAFAQQLVENGFAYYAFDTPEELQAMRDAAPEGTKIKYGIGSRQNMKNSLTLSAAETQAWLDSDKPYVIRLKVPEDETISFKDLVRGVVRFDSNEVDDKVIMKSDGMPTYHLANIVDDYQMKISHVIRGEEWLPSTPIHILLYRYLGWEDARPVFSHLPLILKPDPSSFLKKGKTAAFANLFVEEFIRKNPDFLDKENVLLTTVQQLFNDTAALAARLKPKKKDDEAKIALKAFLKKSLYGKLSKRDGDRLGFPVFPLNWEGPEPFKGFREWGFRPDAVLNFLALLGWNAGTNQEFFSLTELITTFDLEKVNKSGARFDFEKAKWFNQQYLIKANAAALAQEVASLAENAGYKVSLDYIQQVVTLLKERVHFLPDFITQGYYFFAPVDLEQMKAKETKNFQKKVLKKWNNERREKLALLVEDLLSLTDFTENAIKTTTETFMQTHGWSFGDVLPIFRLALSGTMAGPSVFEMIELFGKAKTQNRLEAFFDFCDKELINI